MVNTCKKFFSQNFIPLPKHILEILRGLQPSQPESIPSSFYIYDLVEQRTLCSSSSISVLLGYTAEEIDAMGHTGLAHLIHSDDLQHVAKHYQRFTSLHCGDVIYSEYRMKHSNGSWCWIRSQETPLVTASDGYPLQILGLIQASIHPVTSPITKYSEIKKVVLVDNQGLVA